MKIGLDFNVRAQQRMDFFTEGSVIVDYGFEYGQKRRFKVKWWINGENDDLFLTNTVFHFTRHYLMDGRGVDSCDVLSVVWTLLLTVPIHCRGSVW